MLASAATASPSPAARVYVPYALGGETVEVAAGAGPSRRRQPARGRERQCRSASHHSARISASAAVAPSSTGRPSAIAPGSASRGRHAGAGRDSMRGRAGGRCPWLGRRRVRCMRAGHARGAGGRLRRGQPTTSPDRPLPDSRSASDGALGAAGRRRGVEAGRQAARHPVTATDAGSISTSAAPARSRRMIATVTGRRTHRLARLTRHGELV